LKIAITTSGETLEAPLDSRFGRAAKFLIYDLDTESFEVIDNQQNLNTMQGSGIQSAELMSRLGVSCLVTGHCGPKAYRVLAAAKIKIFNCQTSTVSDALAAYRAGILPIAQSADVAGHWS
jgi:predicted Fe-Mo cluster-binding NifX family protein